VASQAVEGMICHIFLDSFIRSGFDPSTAQDLITGSELLAKLS